MRDRFRQQLRVDVGVGKRGSAVVERPTRWHQRQTGDQQRTASPSAASR